MCGIAGVISRQPTGGEVVRSMTERLRHRGPDDTGFFTSHDGQVQFGHTRLAIVDLSPGGHQPMQTPDKNLTIIFNGEIYNYKTLKAGLAQKGYRFSSTSDTEVLLYAYAEYGHNFLKHLSGMFALALYDAQKDLVILARDPAGVKPLFYREEAGTVSFASEVQALAHGAKKLTLSGAALSKYLSQNYTYGDETIYREIKCIPAGSSMLVQNGIVSIVPYFELPTKKTTMSFDSAVTAFTELFTKEVDETLQADVPVGTFLSGGIDSALVSATIHKLGYKLTAFTIGFEGSYDESAIAKKISTHIGFKHIVHTLHPNDILKDLDAILDSFGQPFGDFSALPTWYVSKLAREHGVKVVLSGDGADELFGGYPTAYLPSVLTTYHRLPSLVQNGIYALSQRLPASHRKVGWDEIFKRFAFGARFSYQRAHFLWKIIFSENEAAELLEPGALEEYKKHLAGAGFEAYMKNASGDRVDAVLRTDFATFLRYDGLQKTDICSMRHGLELRVPFLNKDIITFAFSLPSEYKVRVGKTKILLRSALQNMLPRDITSLKKQGFTPPLSHWLKNELRPYMTDVLSEAMVRNTGIIRYDAVKRLMNEHITGRQDNTRRLWGLMSLVRFLNKHSLTL